MSTENKPLLSDEQYRVLSDRMIEEHRKYGNALRPGHWAEIAARKVVSHMDDFLLADRAKTREVVQKLVDAMELVKDTLDLYVPCQCDGLGCHLCRRIDKADNALFLAKAELGIEPTPQKP